MESTLKTILLFGVLGVLLIVLGNYFGGRDGLIIMAFFSLFINLFLYFFSAKIAIRSAHAKPLNHSKYLAVYEIADELSQKAQMPLPRLYLSPNLQPNAFATGRNPKNSAIVLTTGLINNLSREELRGVIAHEFSHIKNRDILISTIAAVMASLVTGTTNLLRWTSIFSGDDNRNPLADLVVIILAPLAAIIVQLAISRSREYSADESGAKLAGEPDGLADALEKIEQLSQRSPAPIINPAFENLYIINPLQGQGIMGVFQKLFSTHPPVQERVAKLRSWSYNEN